jgi:hypothetical protein
MALSNPLKGERKAGTVGKPLPGVQVSWTRTFHLQVDLSAPLLHNLLTWSDPINNSLDDFYNMVWHEFLTTFNKLIFYMHNRSRFLQMGRGGVKELEPAVSFALKALHCLKNIGNFQRCFQNVMFLHLMILKSSISNNYYLFFWFFLILQNVPY